MKHLRKFNEKVRADHDQDDNRVFADDLDRVVWFVRDNEDDVLELIELWETSHGRDFNMREYYKWFDNHMLYEEEVEDEEITEGRREKMAKTGNKNVETKEDKKPQTKQEIMKLLKSRENVKVKEDGANDLKVFLEDDHIIQVMIRDTKITIEDKTIKSKENKKDFDYNQWGKIKLELSDIIKSCK